MKGFNGRLAARFAISASALAMVTCPAVGAAQDASSTVGNPGPSQTPPSGSIDAGTTQSTAVTDGTVATNAAPVADDVVVTGIRASLRRSIDLKRDAQGIVDAISAEEIGKFPDTNLAESLQRITGVSIDRANGEGQFVTVRGFGPEYNLVVLNGRQLPSTIIGDGNGAPTSRSFDFANLASEGVAALEVYKSGRATVPSGGIGSTINIRTPRPFDKMGVRGSLTAKGVYDTSQNGHKDVTPEISGIFSDTFADDRIGILIDGAYQVRHFSQNAANVGFRDGYLGSENNWGSLAQAGDPRFANIQNRPKAGDVYQVPQNAGYDVVDGRRQRINGQAVLQFRPFDGLTGTVDFTYSRNTVSIRDDSVGIWYNHNDTSSAWTNGPVAGPIFYTERFAAAEAKDLAYSASQTAYRSENKSLGGNLTWDVGSGVTLVLDGHHSTAESKPNSPYGNSNSFGTAVFGIQSQSINFANQLPVISFNMYPGIDPLNAANIVPTGNAFRNSYFRDEINQGQFKGHWDAHDGFLDSLDWGFEYTDNKVRSAYSVLQNDTWGGAGGDSAAQRAAAAAVLPDSIFTLTSIPDKFSGISGANDPNIVKSFYTFDLPTALSLTDAATRPAAATSVPAALHDRLARPRKDGIAPYFQFNGKFELFSVPGHMIAWHSLRKTDVTAIGAGADPGQAAQQNSQNEFNVLFSGRASPPSTASYHNWLPSVDLDFQPLDRTSSCARRTATPSRVQTMTVCKADERLDTLFRVGGGTGSVGNPEPDPVQVEEHRPVGGMVLRQRELSLGWLLPQERVELHQHDAVVNTTIPDGVAAPTTTFNGVTARTGRATRRRSTRSAPTRPSRRSSDITSTPTTRAYVGI